MNAEQIGLFDGATYDDARDGRRLNTSLARIQRAMADGRWYTLAELARIGACSTAAASARVRDLRKQKYGGHTVSRRYDGDGVWSYRMED